MMKIFYPFILIVFLFSGFTNVHKTLAQQGFDNATRALYILDISRYVEWPPSFIEQEYLTIGVLDKDDVLYWELENLVKTRRYIQGKPVRVYLFRDIQYIERTNVLYLNSENGYNIKNVLHKTKGQGTLVISEGYQFRESMLNFVTVEGKPKFELNESLLNEEGMKVDELFLAHAIKTREDWEALFQVTTEELQEERLITEEQKIIIAGQEEQIQRQRRLINAQEEKLDSLNREINNKLVLIDEKESMMLNHEMEIGRQQNQIREQLLEVERQSLILENQAGEIANQQSLILEQTTRIDEQGGVINEQVRQIEKQKLITWFILFALLLVSGIGYVLFLNYRNKKKANKALEDKNRLITMQRDQIAYQKKHITDSIEYAKKIQKAILPSLELFSDEIDHFVLYKPRDIVSGDFYWVDRIDNKQVVITADCTGHGVPGAFMSMLGVTLLNEIVRNRKTTEPDKILNALREEIIISLKQMEIKSEIRDGMDMTAMVIDYNTSQLDFAGANNPLVLIRNGELQVLKGDKMPVAIHERMLPFTKQSISLVKGDAVYAFTDGYPDQFGGPNDKKFLVKNFKELLVKVHHMEMYEQAAKLDSVFEEWKSEVEQVDDVTVVGIRY